MGLARRGENRAMVQKASSRSKQSEETEETEEEGSVRNLSRVSQNRRVGEEFAL